MRRTGFLLAVATLGLTLPFVAAHGDDPLHSGCHTKRHQLNRRQVSATGEGATPAGGGAAAAHYSCDPNTCKLPNCRCADVKPPGNLAIEDVPQFITLTADDGVTTFTIDALNRLMNGRKNPNGCPVKATYFAQLDYTNYSSVTNWYVAGHDVSDHTVTHVAQPSDGEIRGNLIAMNALAGIPYKSMIGFRAPFLNYTKDTLVSLNKFQFTYDSSASSSVPATDPNTDAFWPYTLDNGMANDCGGDVAGICGGEPKLPGFWEIPMYSTYESPTAPHLMDPWLDADPNVVAGWMRNTFMDHYNGNKQPFGLYSHPINLASGYPGLPDPTNKINAINSFLDFAHSNQSMRNVWMVSNSQLLAWMRNPVPASQLNNLDEFKCQAPQVDQAVICNGMPDKEATVVQNCISDTPGDSLNNSPFRTCYGCPLVRPTVDVPNPPQNNASDSLRHRIADNCDTPFWDPIAGKCLNSGFSDETRAIGQNGEGITSTGNTNADGATSSGGGDGYSTFGGPGSGAAAVGLPSVYIVLSLALSALVAAMSS